MQAALSEPIEITLHVAKVLARLGVPYLVGGSYARSFRPPILERVAGRVAQTDGALTHIEEGGAFTY